MQESEFLDVNKQTSFSFSRTGSFRKVLPTTPSTTTDSRLSMSMRMIERPAGSGSNNNVTKAYAPFMLEYAIMAEFQIYQKQDLPGMYVIPSEQDPLIWFGVLFVRQGLYQGGVFRFMVHIPSSFPDGGCPKIFFETQVFHPAINPLTGQLNVEEEFHEWKKQVHQIWHVLQYTRRVLYKLETKTVYNAEAADLFVNDHYRFIEKVKECVLESKLDAYNARQNEDLHYIHFEVYDETIHGPVRQRMMVPPVEGA